MISKTNKLLNELVKLHPKYIDLSLERLRILLNKLENPHLNLPKTIHIAGTNGKGSILSFIRNILVSNGYSCDAYISPHLSRFNERIILNNKEVTTSKLYKTLKFVKNINRDNPITFFEITTAAAFLLFNKSKSDFLILETGLGGKLDATNIIPKKICSIITPISFDHEEFLGKTIKKITNEKLGIVKYNDFVLVSKQKKNVMGYIRKKLSKKKKVLFYGKSYKINEINKNNFQFQFNKTKIILRKPILNGLHQIENASVALAFSEVMKEKNYKMNLRKINNAIKSTVWPGRLEELNYNGKKIILDGSHNIGGAEKLREFLKMKKEKPVFIFGMLNNKKLDIFLNILKKQIKNLLAIKIPNEKNSFQTNEIHKKCLKLSIKCLEMKNSYEVIKYIKMSNERFFIVTGSLYLVGNLRNKFL